MTTRVRRSSPPGHHLRMSRAAPSGGGGGGGDRAARSAAASRASARSSGASSHSEFSVILHTLEQWSGLSQLQWTCCNPQSSQRTQDDSVRSCARARAVPCLRSAQCRRAVADPPPPQSAGLERGAHRHAEDGLRRAETRGRVLPQRDTDLA